MIGDDGRIRKGQVMRASSTSRPSERPAARRTPARPGDALGLALAAFLAVALVHSAAARAYASIDHAAPAAARSDSWPVEGVRPDLPVADAAAQDDEIQLAMLDIGPILYGLALDQGDGYGPPAWRGYVLKSTLWLGLFVLLVALSAAARERQAHLRRRAWRRRAEGLYE
jgi:hypothetical protein